MATKKWTVHPDDLQMCEWACNYLQGKSKEYSKLSSESNYDFFIRVLSNQKSDSDRYVLLSEMQTAWRQKRHKDRQKSEGKKSCSYFLSEKSLEQLGFLASSSRSTREETLEKIISKAHIKEMKKLDRNLKKLASVLRIPSN